MLTATEYHMHEPVPLHRAHTAIFDFCRGRADVVVFGAQAVNVWVKHPRMSQDVNLLTTDPSATADALARALGAELHITARVREVKPGLGYRVYQARKEGNRHLADVRRADFPLDDAVERDGVRYTAPALTVAMKVCAYAKRRMAPKGATDLADLRRLFLAYPELRSDTDAVTEALARVAAEPEALAAWLELLAAPIVSDEETDEGY
jgi:hypothetical protein